MRDDFLVPSVPCYCCDAPTSGTDSDALPAKEPFAADSFSLLVANFSLQNVCVAGLLLQDSSLGRARLSSTCPVLAVSTAEPHD